VPPAWRTSRHAGRVAVTLFLAATSAGISAPHVLADPPASPQTQAASLLSLIQGLGHQEDALSEKYDAANLQVQGAQLRVAQANLLLQAAKAAESHAHSVLTQDAVSSYESGGQSVGGSPNNDNTAVVKTDYQGTLATTEREDVGRYHRLSQQTTDVRTNLQKAEADDENGLNAVSQSRQATQALISRLNQAYSQVQGQIATAFAQQQAAQQAADQQAAERRLAAAQASTTTSTTSPPPSTTPVTAPPRPVSTAPPTSTSTGATGSAPLPQGSGVGEAIAAAESRVGDPYVFGGAGPTGFDCSGLVQWAFAQAGISLPHNSGAQYADTVHIPMSALEPGDLVFFADPGQHVAMYIGNGEIVEAPHTGATVQITGLYSEFVLAGRVN
jgi:peptidoglycan DL-endopeptidase CwlO